MPFLLSADRQEHAIFGKVRRKNLAEIAKILLTA